MDYLEQMMMELLGPYGFQEIAPRRTSDMRSSNRLLDYIKQYAYGRPIDDQLDPIYRPTRNLTNSLLSGAVSQPVPQSPAGNYEDHRSESVANILGNTPETDTRTFDVTGPPGMTEGQAIDAVLEYLNPQPTPQPEAPPAYEPRPAAQPKPKPKGNVGGGVIGSVNTSSGGTIGSSSGTSSGGAIGGGSGGFGAIGSSSQKKKK